MLSAANTVGVVIDHTNMVKIDGRWKYPTEEARRAARRATIAKQIQKLRQAVLDQYGNACTCCGETERIFLTLDHVNNDSHVDRLNGSRRDTRTAMRRALREPGAFTILCFNCNSGRYLNGGVCPHVQG